MGSTTNVLVLIKGLGIGGAEKLISEAARLWDRENFTYSVAYVLPWKDQLVGELEDLGIEVTCIGSERGMGPATIGRLRNLIRSQSIDLVHAHLPSMGVLARLAAGVPVVYTEHNMASSYRPLTRFANRITYSMNAALIAVSGAVADSVSTWPGRAPAVIPNGVACEVAPEAAKGARSELGLSQSEALVAHVGNIRPGKGHDTLIDTAIELSSRRNGIRFVSIGVEKHAGDLDRVRGRVAEAGLEHTVRFLGRRADALSFVAACDVFVNPSDVEGLPVAILEAMSLAKPIVATAVGGVPSVIRDGETGILVEPGDPAALAKGIERLLDDPDLRARLGASAQRLVADEFGLERMVRAYEATYRNVLEG